MGTAKIFLMIKNHILPFQISGNVPLIQPFRQEVRPRILIPVFAGSNPVAADCHNGFCVYIVVER